MLRMTEGIRPSLSRVQSRRLNAHLIGPLAVLLVLAALAAALSTRRRRVPRPDEPWPLEAKTTLLSAPEQQLYRRLIQALPEYVVLAQVQLLQLVRFRRGRWNAAIANRISQLSVDFLIVRPDTSIVAAIELDDASHARERRQAADARKAHALKSSGIPLLRWAVREMPDVLAIAAAVRSVAGTSARPI